MTKFSSSRAVSLLVVALLVLILDQLSKYYLLEVIGMATRTPIEVTGFFRLVMVWNPGVSFGMLQHDLAFMKWFLIALALGISWVLVRLGLRSASLIERVGYAMVVGGALGNVVDRLRFGAVADFFYFHVGDLGWPAFNIADASICLGVGVLLWRMTFHPTHP